MLTFYSTPMYILSSKIEWLESRLNETWEEMQKDETVTLTLYGSDPLRPTGPRKDFDVTDRLPQITEKTVPGGVLLTNGYYDMSQDEGMVPFFTLIRARVKWVRFARSSHMAQLEEPEAYLTALADFLAMP